jgi:hypothetical protein
MNHMSTKTTAPNTQLGGSYPENQVSSESRRRFWQFRIYSLRTKLIAAFVAVVVLSMAIVAFLANRSLSNNLTSEIVSYQAFLAASQGFQIGQAINSQFENLKGLAIIRTIQAMVEDEGLKADHPEDVAEIDRLNRAWREAVEADDINDPMVVKVLYHPLVAQLRDFQKAFPENSEVLITDQKGFTIVATNPPNNYYQADTLWWRLAHENGQYIGQPIYNPSTNTIALDMAMPILSYRDGQFVGVLHATVNFDILTDLLIQGLHGQTGYSVIYQPNDQEIKLNPLENGEFEIVQEFASNDLREILKSSIQTQN